MKKAFTLIELMISVLLLSLIVTFLYQSVAQLQTSNLQFLKKTDKLQKREALVKLLYNDFINASSVQWFDKNSKSDAILIQTSNSFHDMSKPFVLYKVYKEENSLKRIESPIEKIDYINNVFKYNELITDVTLFKVYGNKGHYLIYLKAKGIEDIYFDILPPSFLSQAVQKPTTGTPPPGTGTNTNTGSGTNTNTNTGSGTNIPSTGTTTTTIGGN